jgi:hypothetical protein
MRVRARVNDYSYVGGVAWQERHEGAPLSQGQIQELTAKYGLKTLSEDVERILRIGEDDGSSSKTSIK